MKNTSKIKFLSPGKLLTHPKNLRRFYPDKDVIELAGSISAAGGVLQALRVVSNGNGKFVVVDGNMRLAAGQKLGKDCPPLKCEIVTDTEAEQLLAMIVTAKYRYKPDPVSEALHFERLIKEQGYKINQIVKETGLNYVYIKSRLLLLELDAEIQDLIATKSLPKGSEAVEALLSVKDKDVRLKLAKRLAASSANNKVVISACERVNASLQGPKAAPSAASLAKETKPKQKRSWAQMRKALFGMCETCDKRLASTLEEPAWTLVSHAAKTTCDRCDIKDVNGACLQCPGVELIRRLADMSKESK